MRVLLIFYQDAREMRVMVNLKERRMRERVVSLLENDCGREAFDLLRTKAEVEAYFPFGARSKVRPDMTLFEDMCR